MGIDRSNELYIPEKRIIVATSIIKSVVPSLDEKNVFGILGFGSFWSPEVRRKPDDIDLAVYVRNDAIFIEGDRDKLQDPLQKNFNLKVETHILTPFTPMVKNQLENFSVMLREGTLLYGRMPEWLPVNKS